MRLFTPIMLAAMPTQPVLVGGQGVQQILGRGQVVQRGGLAFWERKASSLQISRTTCVIPPVVFCCIVSAAGDAQEGRSKTGKSMRICPWGLVF